MIVRSILANSLYWSWSTAQHISSVAFTTLMKFCLLCVTLLAAVRVCQGNMLARVAAYTLSFYTCWWRPNCFEGLVSQQAITSPKLGHFTIFRATQRRCCCQQWFLRGGMMRQQGWNRAMLYKEDYRDKNNIDKSEIWGHFQGDEKTIKVGLFVGRVAACWWTGQKIHILSFLRLEPKADTWQGSTAQRGRHPRVEQSLSASQQRTFSIIQSRQNR